MLIESLVTINEKVVYLIQLLHLQETYKVVISGYRNKLQLLGFKPKSNYFFVNKPHIEKQANDFESKEQESAHNTKHTLTLKRKRRKRKVSYNEGEVDLIVYHNSIKNYLIDAALAVNNHFTNLLPIELQKQQDQSTVLAATLCSLEIHKKCSFMQEFQELFTFIKFDDKYNFKLYDLPPVIVTNDCLFAHMINIAGNTYLIPKQCKFLCSDITRLDPLVNECKKFGKYSCIVLDPPWENKSVKRSKRYSTLTFEQIASLPMDELCQDGCLIIIWVTNKQKILKWVKESLFKQWGITFITEWHWVKLTALAEPVFPWESMHKKPYETLIIGFFQNCPKLTDCSDLCDLVICSMPSTIHSHKPSLSKVIISRVKQYYNEPFRCLELFARNLTPGWTSWGNEVLMMQNLTYFELL